MIHSKKAILLLEDGTIFHGKSIGAVGTTTGELCFNTGMTGYQEIFTDPSYFKQLLVTTNIYVGNYGIKHSEEESSSIKIQGLICRNYIEKYSRVLADESIQTYFESNNLVAISDVDTRAVVRHIRNKGAMNAIISSEIEDLTELKSILNNVPSMEGLELASKVSTNVIYELGIDNTGYRIAVLDYGVKKNILRNFLKRNCKVRVFPAKTELSTILEWNPNAFFLSNGPGDPASMNYAINTVKQMFTTKIPIFGICLGHQLLALANDIGTYKMHFGHRGINHPVINKNSGKCEITSQNHGFAVKESNIFENENIEITHLNLNDQSIEGLKMKNYPAFSVQYHPEAAPGPHDSEYLFDDFIRLIELHTNTLKQKTINRVQNQ
jgi:carbamoyl-phosphate synthase small subunit